MDELQFELNPALETVADNKALWNSPDFRRWGFHNLHYNARWKSVSTGASAIWMKFVA